MGTSSLLFYHKTINLLNQKWLVPSLDRLECTLCIKDQALIWEQLQYDLYRATDFYSFSILSLSQLALQTYVTEEMHKLTKRK